MAMKKLKNLSLVMEEVVLLAQGRGRRERTDFSFLLKMNTLIHIYIFIYLYIVFAFLLIHKNATPATIVLDSPIKLLNPTP
jgi:hypothetical protein